MIFFPGYLEYHYSKGLLFQKVIYSKIWNIKTQPKS